MLMPGREESPELLDQGLGSPADVRRNFEDMWRVQRWLGGLRLLQGHLAPRLAGIAGPVTLLDVGAGTAQVSAALGRWAARQGWALQILGLELAHRNLALAQPATGLHLLQGDALHLPFAPNSVDFVIASLFLHHLSPAQLLQFLPQALRVARRGLIFGDLTRGWLPLLAFRLTQPIFARSYLTRHDGALSIRRAYTPAELRQIAAQAGLEGAQVYRHPFWQMALVVDKGHV